MILLRYFKRNLLLLVTLVGIISFLSCGISYVITFSKENKENGYYFNNSTYSLVFSEEDINGEGFYKELINVLSKDVDVNLINTNMSSYFGQAQGIYLNSNLQTTPQIKEGRFFNVDDFKDNNSKLAVVGVSKASNIKIKDNKKIINFNGSDYEVIGIMGDEKLSKEVNNKIIFNLNSLINVDSTEINSSDWFLSSTKDLSSSMDNLQNNLKDFKFIYSKAQEISNPVLSVLDNQAVRIYYLTTIFASVFVNIFIIIFFWFDGFKKEIGVRKSFGANNQSIYLYIFKLFLINNVIATIIASSILIYLEKLEFMHAEYYFHTINLISIFVFILIFSIFILFILIKRINNIKPNFILRGIKS
ncbi:ABC transporter permease [Clostridium sp. VAP23]|uniref:FtsX-like permease family protein n=1 Tax=Clostridium sp. VAP23 TaxID=2949981 RepID=UPI00207AB9EF|nr:ABC transporter permease [Clostridium sp. VAP23]